MNRVALLVAGSAWLGGCLVPTLSGTWEIEVADADDCALELDLDERSGDVDGEADIDCLLFLVIDGYDYTYRLDEGSADVEGDSNGEDFDLEVSWFDDVLGDVAFVLDGNFDGPDAIEGDVELSGDEFGEFVGAR